MGDITKYSKENALYEETFQTCLSFGLSFYGKVKEYIYKLHKRLCGTLCQLVNALV